MIDCLKMGFENWAALEDNANKNDNEAEKNQENSLNVPFVF